MRTDKYNQKGSIMVEVIAVIALLAVMGPLLFRQISRRNEEVSNVNAASEIRMVKEAFNAFIQAYSSELNEVVIAANQKELFSMNNLKIDGENLPEYIVENTCDFLPTTHADLLGCADDDFSGAQYKLLLFADPPINASMKSVHYIGFVLPEVSAMPEGFSLRRAARIASLIGADGGILKTDDASGLEVYGVAGTWGDDSGYFASYFADAYKDSDIHWADGDTTYLATTGVIDYETTNTVEDFDKASVELPDSLSFNRLHAYNYFSVANNLNCFRNKARGDSGTESDEILLKGETGTYGKCDPLFWVDGTGNTDGVGDVYVRNALHIGEGATIYAGKAKDIDAGKAVEFVYNDDGSVEIKQTSANAQEALLIQGSRIDTNLYAPNASEQTGEVENYRLNPSDVSVMNDIRLESKGGAKLSELLPDQILKTSIHDTVSATTTVQKPTCPKNYSPAIVVLPEHVHTSISVDKIAEKLKIEGTTGSQKITAESGSSVEAEGILVDIQDQSSNWLIKIDNEIEGAGTHAFNATIQTYCVYQDTDSTKPLGSTGPASSGAPK